MQIGLMLGFVFSGILPFQASEGELATLAHFTAYALAFTSAAIVFGWTSVKNQKRCEEQVDLALAVTQIAREYGLTAREVDVFELLAQGRGLPYVRSTLHIAPGTASTHVNHIYQKLGVHTREELLDLVHKTAVQEQ